MRADELQDSTTALSSSLEEPVLTPERVIQLRGVNLETTPFYAVAAYLGIRAVYIGLVTDYVGDLKGWQHGFWGRPNTTDALIVKLIQQLVEAVELH